jgi:hypothetical protein
MLAQEVLQASLRLVVGFSDASLNFISNCRKGHLARAILEFYPADNTNREALLQDIRVAFGIITELCVVKVPGPDRPLLRERTWRELSERRPHKEREAIAS